MTVEMLITVDQNDTKPIYMQLVDSVSELIERGILKGGDKMPSVRALALKLAINPNTIQKAYTELEHRGKLKNEAGRGCYVSHPDDEAEKNREAILSKLKKLLSAAKDAGVSNDEIIQMSKLIYDEETRDLKEDK